MYSINYWSSNYFCYLKLSVCIWNKYSPICTTVPIISHKSSHKSRHKSSHKSRHQNHKPESFSSCTKIIIQVHPFCAENILCLIWNMEVVANKFHSYLLYKTVIDELKLQHVKCCSSKIYVICHFFDFLNICIIFGAFWKMYIAEVRSIPICFVSKSTRSNTGRKFRGLLHVL